MPRTSFTYNGVRYHVRGKTEQELLHNKIKKQMELEQNKIRESNVLFKEYSWQWFDIFKAPYIQDASKTMYVTKIKLLCGYIGSLRMKDITAADLQTIIKTEYDKGRSKSHMDKLHLTITQIFERAAIDRQISYNPALAIIKPKLQEQTGRALTPKERAAVLEVAKTHKYGLWIRFMLYLGVRPSESANIKYEDIDKDSMYIYIPKGKTRKSIRRIPIPRPLQDDIRGLEGKGYIFTTEAGNRLDSTKIRRRWNSFKRDLDIYMGATVYRNQIIKSVLSDDLVLYCLRHTYGTDGQAAGVPIDILADLMGHEKIETTRKYYIDENEESKNRARKFYDEFYEDKDSQKIL